MPDHDLDIDRRIRPTRRMARTLLAVTLLVGTVVTFAARPQAGPASTPISAPLASTAHLPPSTETTSSIGGLGLPVRQINETGSPHQTSLPLRQRHMLIALLMICFAALSLGGYALWRRSFAELGRES